MKYKNIANFISVQEIQEVLEIIYPYVQYKGYQLQERAVKVFFTINDEMKYCTFLPDEVQDMPEGMELSADEQYEYKKYMVANGYSELWINNHYAHSC